MNRWVELGQVAWCQSRSSKAEDKDEVHLPSLSGSQVCQAYWITHFDSFTQLVNTSLRICVGVKGHNLLTFQNLYRERLVICRHTSMQPGTGLGEHTQSSDLNLSWMLSGWMKPEAVRLVTVLPSFSLSSSSFTSSLLPLVQSFVTIRVPSTSPLHLLA